MVPASCLFISHAFLFDTLTGKQPRLGSGGKLEEWKGESVKYGKVYNIQVRRYFVHTKESFEWLQLEQKVTSDEVVLGEKFAAKFLSAKPLVHDSF